MDAPKPPIRLVLDTERIRLRLSRTVGEPQSLADVTEWLIARGFRYHGFWQCDADGRALAHLALGEVVERRDVVHEDGVAWVEARRGSRLDG